MLRRAFVLSVLVSLFISLFISLSAVSVTAQTPQTITVFAAASLTDVFEAIASDFEAQNPTYDVVFNFAGSSALATQIGEGAPADVFASADQRQMDNAIATGRIAEGASRAFAHNRLVIALPADNPANITHVRDLANEGVLLVLAGEGVPVRTYTDEAFSRLASAYGSAWREAVYANVVSQEDNVRQVLAKVVLGEADAGTVYRTDALTEAVTVVDIPLIANPRVSYPIAALNDSTVPEGAAAFIDFVFSEAGQSQLAAFGFETVR